MTAQDRHEGSDINGRPAPKRQSRRPTKFMFIDSSNGGVNAKPDRTVRSFVMKSARNRKTWSTRPRSPKEEDFIDAQPSEELPDDSTVRYQPTFAGDPWTLQDIRKDSLWDNHAPASPASSRTGSIFSSHGGNYTCESPSSSHTSPLPVVEYNHAAHVFDFPRTVVTQRPDLSLRSPSPFDCLSVRLDPHARQLLHQFVVGSASRLIPVDLHSFSSVAATDWIAKCIQSPNGASYIYAALTASARGAGLNSEAYKWRAITEVNKSLSDPRTRIDDTTIATVLMLLAMEESDLADPRRQGNDRECSLSANNAHLNGLRTMIRQRGGLASLDSNRCLQVFILMHSTAQCITTFRRPYALLFGPTGEIEDYAAGFHPDSRHPAISIPFQRLYSDILLPKVIESIDLFISDLANWYETGRNPYALDPFELQKHACLLTYRLFDWYQTGEDCEMAGNIGRDPLDQSICLAHLIFLVMATEPLAPSLGSRLAKVVLKLRQALQRVPLSDWAPSPAAFLWTLTMGGLAAKDLPRTPHVRPSELAFFVQYSQLAFPSKDNSRLASAQDLLQQVQRCPWIPSVLDARARRLWAQMGLCMPDIVDLYESSSEEEGPLVDNEHALGQSTTARFFPSMKAGSKKSSPR
ncbi:hypothetical protein E8E12_007086 [Didymella heteroderae]|uniref:Uncharacterized protein n=1 Tax=Didymella heteroderae TaxID=1769908 RepID=A0A9P5BYH1_9PLEO|nr:hypothetical protein E8E12_007086 [Didymella heteroderae]